MSYRVIDRKDQEIITRALNMAAIDDEAAALVLEAMIVKKDALVRDLREENEFLRENLRYLELEVKRDADH